ncbi:MAG: YbhB/YbcL family Raf kinase inhibitor-like protein [Lysobacteraceae bacterium]
MRLTSHSFANGAAIPAEFAFGRSGDAGEPCVLSANRNPHLAWDEAPAGTQSFLLVCIDPDAPSSAADVNQPDRTVPADLPRAEFCHWVLADIPADCREIAAGACSDGVTAGGKQQPAGPAGSRQGRNDYTGWFAGDADMKGEYLGYDGPCPPFNDSIAHRYFFRLYALDTDQLDLSEPFTLADALRAAQVHVLAEATLFGVYSLNPALR